MDGLENSKPNGRDDHEPIRFEDESEKPIPFDDSDDDTPSVKISHSPLNLGGKEKGDEKPIRPTIVKPAEKIVSNSERITGAKTFFTPIISVLISMYSFDISAAVITCFKNILSVASS